MVAGRNEELRQLALNSQFECGTCDEDEDLPYGDDSSDGDDEDYIEVGGGTSRAVMASLDAEVIGRVPIGPTVTSLLTMSASTATAMGRSGFEALQQRLSKGHQTSGLGIYPRYGSSLLSSEPIELRKSRSRSAHFKIRPFKQPSQEQRTTTQPQLSQFMMQ